VARDLRPNDLPALDPLSPDQVVYANILHARLLAHRGDWGRCEGAAKPGAGENPTSAPAVVLAPVAQQTYDWLTESGVLPVFDWMAWPAKRELIRSDVSALSPDLARALLTALVLQDRASDGSLLGAFRHGIITRLIGVLATDPETQAVAEVERDDDRVLEPI